MKQDMKIKTICDDYGSTGFLDSKNGMVSEVYKYCFIGKKFIKQFNPKHRDKFEITIRKVDKK